MAMLLPLLVSCGGNEAKPTGTDTPHSGEDKQDTEKKSATVELSPGATSATTDGGITVDVGPSMAGLPWMWDLMFLTEMKNCG